MNRAISAILAAVLAATSPALTTEPADPPDWWLIYDEDKAAPARFVNLAALHQTPDGLEVPVLTIAPDGREQRRTTLIRCDSTLASGSVPAFVCGSEAYRQRSGLNIRDFPPEQLAALYFRTRGH